MTTSSDIGRVPQCLLNFISCSILSFWNQEIQTQKCYKTNAFHSFLTTYFSNNLATKNIFGSKKCYPIFLPGLSIGYVLGQLLRGGYLDLHQNCEIVLNRILSKNLWHGSFKTLRDFLVLLIWSMHDKMSDIVNTVKGGK